MTEFNKNNMQLYKNKVSIEFCKYGCDYTNEMVIGWLEQCLWFIPKTMSSTTATKYNTRRYNKEKLYNGLIKDILDKQGYYTIEGDNVSFENINCQFNKSSCLFKVFYSLEYYLANKSQIHKILDKLFIQNNCIIGYLSNYFDDKFIQNPAWKSTYTDYDISLDGIEIIPSDLPGFNDDKINTQLLPGHYDFYAPTLFFKVSQTMWFGPDFYIFFSKNKLENIQNCLENKELANNFRKITLYDDVTAYDEKENRQKQWDFRNGIDMEEIVHKIINKPFIHKDSTVSSDPQIEFKTGEFEHGGDFLAMHYFNSKNKPCPKSKSIGYYYVEYNSFGVVFEEKVLNLV